jgi:RNA polymerase sigma factor (sigma-70 family)
MAASTVKESDRRLLERFVSQGDETAFTKLVQRHGPMVLGVCRQILRNEDDAEDAFQATFLVLARKARSIRAAEALPNWLYGVARRLAMRSRSAVARRHAREVALVEPPTEAAPETQLVELAPVLHEEIGRLPEKYRIPLVLCYLEGKSNEEAARQLGCPSGTVFSRLARARERLRGRLTRRGLALSAGALTATLAAVSQQVRAAAPAQLATTTVARAIRFGGTKAAPDIPVEIRELAEWGVQSLPRRGVQVAVAVGVLLLLCALGLALLLVLRGSEPAMAERLQGTWQMTAFNIAGNPAPPQALQAKLVFNKDRVALTTAQGAALMAGTFRVDADKNPMEMDWILPNGISRGIFKLEGKTLTIAVFTGAGAGRPADFTPGPGKSVMVFEGP